MADIVNDIVGLKDKFLANKREVINKVYQLKEEGKSWNEIEKYVKDNFRDEIGLLKPNLFTYFLIIGGTFLLPSFFLWKIILKPGTTAYFFAGLFFTISAVFTLKGLWGHFVTVFLNKDRFKTELNILKHRIEGGNDGRQPN